MVVKYIGEQPPTNLPRAEERNQKLRYLRNVLLIVFSLLAGSGIAAWNLLWKIPSESRLFASLLTISMYFVAGGLVSLMFIIPAAGSDYEIKTEFYSVRAAYYCVIAGLAMAIVVTVGMILGGLHVFSSR